ncbi:MAG: TlpA disulfide reductase family protein [Rhodocyclaceae bacterium]|jgi:thiol-disulfide isomerase/thioredoxin|nr:TlpA disulfide reductase family protein [Rhodocyclaceae bacterium]
MKPALRHGLVVLVVVAAAGAGALTRQTLDRTGAPPPSAQAPASQFLSLILPDTQGTPQALAQWHGQVVVANFWATWCPPCRTEIPAFARISERYAGQGVQFLGISIDTPAKVEAFQKEAGVPYPLLIGSPETLELSARLGNHAQALPFTAIFDQGGRLRHVRLGTLSESDLEGKIRSLLSP